MPVHSMELPRLVVVGTGVSGKIGDILGNLEIGKRGVVLSGPNVKKLLQSSVELSLKESGFKFRWDIAGTSQLCRSRAGRVFGKR